MSDLATRLRQHVDTASPPIDVDALVRQLQQEPLIVAVPPTRRRFPDWASAVVVAAVVLVVVGGAALLFSGGTSVGPADTVPATTMVPEPSVESGPVFDLGTDDLCSWFTADEMNRVVATAQERAGTTFVFVPFQGTYSLFNEETGGCFRYPGTHGSSTWQSPPWRDDPAPERYIGVWLWSAPSFAQPVEGRASVSETFASHDMLSGEVEQRVHTYSYGFDEGLVVYLSVKGHEDDPIVFALGVRDPDARDTPKYENLGLAIANELLTEMGWIARSPDVDESADTTMAPVTEVPRPAVKATTVYDLGTEDLCEWLSADEMNQIVAYSQQQAGTQFDLAPLVDPGSPLHSCSGVEGLWWGSEGWTESPAAEGSILIALNSYFRDPDAPVGPEWFDDNPDWFGSHPLLGDGVVYHVSRHTVAYDAGVQLQLRVDGFDDVLVFAFGVGDEAAVATPKYEELGLAIANELLRQMNWIDD